MGEEKRVEKKEERVNSFPVPSTVVYTLFLKRAINTKRWDG